MPLTNVLSYETIDFDKYFDAFRNKHDLIECPFYSDDNEIVDDYSPGSSKTIYELHSDSDVNKFVQDMTNYYNKTYGDWFLNAISKNPTKKSYLEYLELIDFKSDLSRRGLTYAKKAVQGSVVNEASKEAIIEYLMKYFNYDLEEVEVTYFGKKNDFSGLPYGDLATEIKMKYKDKSDGIFRSLYSKDAMAYGPSFPYSDIFTKCTKLKTYINKKLGFNDLNALWIYNDDHDILLIASSGFNFLTTLEMLAEDLEVKPIELLDVIHNSNNMSDD